MSFKTWEEIVSVLRLLVVNGSILVALKVFWPEGAGEGAGNQELWIILVALGSTTLAEMIKAKKW